MFLGVFHTHFSATYAPYIPNGASRDPEALSARLSEKDASLASLQASFHSKSMEKPSTLLPFWRFFVGLGFWTSKPLSTLILLILEANKVLCGRCGMWNTMGSATKCNFQGFCFEVSESFGYHFLNPDTRYPPFFWGGRFSESTNWLFGVLPAVSKGPKGDRTH